LIAGTVPEEDTGFITSDRALAFIRKQVGKPASALNVLFGRNDPLVRECVCAFAPPLRRLCAACLCACVPVCLCACVPVCLCGPVH
jgi:hypothetical protein